MKHRAMQAIALAKRSSPRQRIAFAWAAALVLYVALLAVPLVVLPGDGPGLRRFHTPELAPGWRVGQVFRMTADDFYAVEISPVAVRPTVSGTARLELYAYTGDRDPPPLHVAEVPAADLVRSVWFRFDFPPISASRDRLYRVDVVSPERDPLSGVALRATRGVRYEPGTMVVNGVERWADLAFRTHAPAPSVWGLLANLRGTNPVRGVAVPVALAAIWLLVGVTLRALLRPIAAP